MEFKSRMDKNKHLHESVNREIAQKRKNDLTKTTIYATFEVLKKIDLKFFEEKIRQFDNKYGYEKPYLFEDKSKSILSEDIKFEIKRFIGELDELKVSEFELIDNEDTSRDKVIELRNDQFKEYRKVLIEADKNFENRMFKYKSNQKNNIKFNSDIKMDIVEQVRNNDMRDVYKMVSEVYTKLDTSYSKILKKYKQIVKKSITRKLVFILPIIFIIMAVIAIIPVFI